VSKTLSGETQSKFLWYVGIIRRTSFFTQASNIPLHILSGILFQSLFKAEVMVTKNELPVLWTLFFRFSIEFFDYGGTNLYQAYTLSVECCLMVTTQLSVENDTFKHRLWQKPLQVR